MRRRRVEIASPWRRLAAGVINGIILLACLVSGGFIWFKLGRFGSSDPAEAPRPGPWKPTAPWRAGFGALRVIGAAELRNVRSPGARILRIRRADARTGGPVSFRSAIVLDVASTLSSAVSQELTRPLQARHSDRLKGLEQSIKEIQRTHKGEPEEIQRAIMRLYEENDVNPLRPCVWGLTGPVAIALPIFWSRRHQSLPDRVAGIIVVRE